MNKSTSSSPPSSLRVNIAWFSAGKPQMTSTSMFCRRTSKTNTANAIIRYDWSLICLNVFLFRTTWEIVCKTWYNSRGGCAGVNIDIDVSGYVYLYELYVHDFSEGGVAGTGAALKARLLSNWASSMGTAEIFFQKLEKESKLYSDKSKNNILFQDISIRWWMLGTFEPSMGTSSFSTMDFLQTSDLDTGKPGVR